MASMFTSIRRDLGYQFQAKIREYERASSVTVQARRRRRGLPPLVVYPRPEDIKFSPDGLQMEVFGPLTAEEDVRWKQLLKLERDYLADRAQMRGLRNRSKGDENVRLQLQESVDKLDVFLERTRAEKEKFRRVILTPGVEGVPRGETEKK